MKFKFFRYLMWFIIHTKIYLLWSKFHQWAFQKKRTKLPFVTSIQEVEKILSTSKWTADDIGDLWDVVRHPEHAYYNLLKSGSCGDCDDSACLAGALLQQIGIPGHILSIQWLDKNNKFKGHNVFVYTQHCWGPSGSWSDKNNIFHIGNYNSGTSILVGQVNFNAAAKDYFKLAIEDIVRGGKLISWFAFPINLSKISDYDIES